jgi:hypothetical protein
MEEKKRSTVRVRRTQNRRPNDAAAMKKIARAVIAIAARQIQHDASPRTSVDPSSNEEGR